MVLRTSARWRGFAVQRRLPGALSVAPMIQSALLHPARVACLAVPSPSTQRVRRNLSVSRRVVDGWRSIRSINALFRAGQRPIHSLRGATCPATTPKPCTLSILILEKPPLPPSLSAPSRPAGQPIPCRAPRVTAICVEREKSLQPNRAVGGARAEGNRVSSSGAGSRSFDRQTNSTV
jgi:hypothetical protein